MTTRLAVFDRIVVFTLGLLILLGGVWAVGLYFDVPPAQRMADLIHFPAWLSAPTAYWYDLAIAAVMVFSLVIGGWLIALNLRRRRFNRMRSPATDATGSIDIDILPLSTALARDIGELPRVETVRPTVGMNRNRPTVTFIIRARAGVDMPALRGVLEQAETDFREAVRDIDVDTTYLIHLLPVTA